MKAASMDIGFAGETRETFSVYRREESGDPTGLEKIRLRLRLTVLRDPPPRPPVGKCSRPSLVPKPQNRRPARVSVSAEQAASIEPAAVIQLWHATASSHAPGVVERCCERWINGDEITRADRFRQLKSRNQHVVGRGMARRLLTDGVSRPGDLQFGLLPHGKPIVREPSHARRSFNIAHTDGLVVCGIGTGTSQWVGVDVEHLDRRTNVELAERYFAAPEVEVLRSVRGEAARRRMFLRIWTLKESFIKALGTGMQTPLDAFAFEDIESENPSVTRLSGDVAGPTHWQFWCLEPKPGFVSSVAVGCEQQREDLLLEQRCFDDLAEREWLAGHS